MATPCDVTSTSLQLKMKFYITRQKTSYRMGRDVISVLILRNLSIVSILEDTNHLAKKKKKKKTLEVSLFYQHVTENRRENTSTVSGEGSTNFIGPDYSLPGFPSLPSHPAISDFTPCFLDYWWTLHHSLCHWDMNWNQFKIAFLGGQGISDSSWGQDKKEETGVVSLTQLLAEVLTSKMTSWFSKWRHVGLFSINLLKASQNTMRPLK